MIKYTPKKLSLEELKVESFQPKNMNLAAQTDNIKGGTDPLTWTIEVASALIPICKAGTMVGKTIKAAARVSVKFNCVSEAFGNCGSAVCESSAALCPN